MPNQYTTAKWTDADYIAYWRSKCVVNEQGCWLWQGFVHPKNHYAQAGYRGKQVRLHRAMYEAHRGYKVLEGWDVCHTCDVRHCVNPLHLFAGHHMLNMQDMKTKGRCRNQKVTHCPRGHELSGDNVGIDNRGWRHCKTCEKARQKRQYHNALYRKRHGISKDPKALRETSV